MDCIFRYAGRIILYFLNKCELNINVEVSSITVGDNGNIDSLLNSLAYSTEEVADLELA